MTLLRPNRTLPRKLLGHPAYLPFVTFLLLSFALALILTRGFLWHAGTLQDTADFSTSVFRTAELANWLSGWNAQYGTSNSAIISMQALMLPLVLLLGPSLAPKLALLLTYFVMSLASAAFLFWWSRTSRLRRSTRVVLSLTFSLLYTVNGWVSLESVHLYFVWAYALLPLSACCTIMGLSDLQARRHLLALAAGILTAATFTAYGIAFTAILQGILYLCFISLGKTPAFPTRLRLALRMAGVYVGALTGSCLYWLIPELGGFHANYSAGTSWALFTTSDMFTLSAYTPLLDVIRGLYAGTSSALSAPLIGSTAFHVGASAAYLLPIVATLRLITGRLSWQVIGLGIGAVVFAIFASGTNAPLGSAYVHIAALPGLNSVAFVLFEGPYKLVPTALFCILVLAFDGWLSALRSPLVFVRVLGTVALMAATAASLLLGAPLLTGNLAGYMKPVPVPPSYLAALRAVQSAESAQGPGVTLWLPFDETGSGAQPSWAPKRRTLPLLSGQLPPEAGWLAPTPVSSRSVSWLGPANGRLFDELFVYALAQTPQPNLGRLLALGGVRYVLARHDVGSTQVATLTARHNGLRRIVTNRWLTLYSTVYPVQALLASAATVVVGDPSPLLLNDVHSSSITALPAVWATEMAGHRDLLDLLRQPGAVITFSPGQTWTDLALDAWPSRAALHSAADLAKITAPLSPWVPTTVTGNSWIADTAPYLGYAAFAPTLASSFLVSSSRASLTVPVTPSGQPRYLWIRTLVGPLEGSVTSGLNGRILSTVSTWAPTPGGWRWIRVALLPGSIHGQLQLTFSGALTGLDSYALLPRGSVGSAVSRIRRVAIGATALTAGTWSAFPAVTREQSLPIAPLSMAVTSVSGIVGAARGTPSRIVFSATSHPPNGLLGVQVNLATGVLPATGFLTVQVATSPGISLWDFVISIRRYASARYYLPVDVQSDTVTYDLAAPTGRAMLEPPALAPMPTDSAVVFYVQKYVNPHTSVVLHLGDLNLLEPTGLISISVPQSGAYVIAVRPLLSPPQEQLTDGGIRLLSQPPVAGWYTFPAVCLPGSGLPVAIHPAAGSETLVSALRLGGCTAAQAPRRGTQEQDPGHTRYLALATVNRYGSGWQVTQGDTVFHFVTPFFTNGFVVAGPHRAEIAYAPNAWVYAGRAATAAFLVACGLAAIADVTRRRARGRY